MFKDVSEETTDILLEARGVSHTFAIDKGVFAPKRYLRAVDDVSFSIRRGEVLGIVGESGCGKSTLARILLGIIAPTEGSVEMMGRNIASLDRRLLSRLVQPVFQDPYSSLNPRKSVGEILELPLRVHGIGNRAERDKAVKDMMSQVGLATRLRSALPSQLSGGQRQRVAIARALIIKPSVVICDEPTSALDVSVQAQILNLLMELRQTLGLTLVLISHNLAVVEHLSTRVAVMYLGRIVEFADVETLFANPRHPYAQMLFASLLAPDPYGEIPHVAVSEVPSPINPPSGCTFHPRCTLCQPSCALTRPVLREVDHRQVACDLVR